MVYTVSTKKYIGSLATIVTHNQGVEHPVLHIINGEADFPGDTKQLAENIASLLNGNKPLHQIDMGTTKTAWSITRENGIDLRVRQGLFVSDVGIFLNTLNGAVLTQLQNPDFMKNLCDAMKPKPYMAPPTPREQPAF